MSRFDRWVSAHVTLREGDVVRARERAQAVRQHADAVAEQLAARFGITRVVLYGSLAGGTFGANSDVDLAVEGLAVGALVAAEVAANERAIVDVSVCRIEDALPHILASIVLEGVQLWPR